MHPIEHLRYVARSGAGGHGELVEETALALAGLHGDPAGLVMACRRLIERHPASGPLWTLCARVLCAADAAHEAPEVVAGLEHDPTPGHLVRTLPPEARVTVVGWPEVAAEALARRGDLRVLAVDAGGDGLALARRLLRFDLEVHDVDEGGVAAAVRSSDLVLLEADALGPGGFVGPRGSCAAAAVGRHAGVPVWAVAGAGRVVPARTWEAIVQRLEQAAGDRPWEAAHEVVALDLVDEVVRPGGRWPAAEAATPADAPVAPELLR